MSELGQLLMESMKQAVEIAQGKIPESEYVVHSIDVSRESDTACLLPNAIPDIKSIRADLGLTQIMFASQFGFSVSTLRNWEQGKRKPDPAVRAYLRVIAKAPDTVRAALAE